MAVVVAAVLGVGALDYTGTVQLGLVERVGITPAKPRSGEVAAEPEVTEHRQASEPRAAPAARTGDRNSLFGSIEESEPAATPAVIDEAAGEQELAAARTGDRRASERAAQLQRGVDLLERELAKVRASAEFPTFQITIRPGGGRAPYSAAERVKLADDFLNSGKRWTAQQLFAINDERARSQTQVNNATTRLKELERQRQSLTARIEKARGDLAALETRTP